MMNVPVERLRSIIGDIAGCGVNVVHTLPFGGINQACQVVLSDGRCLFVKSNARAPHNMFQEEARGLRWLAEAESLVIPHVTAVIDQPFALLVLEYLTPKEPSLSDWERLGRGLAGLHDTATNTFGALPDNYVGTLFQSNESTETWVEFYWQRRLLPQVRAAIDAHRAPAAWSARFAKLEARLAERLTEPYAPERVHGDLWSGNVLFVAGRGPCLVDPAAYAGHGEVDLAMMRLFGGFPRRVFDAYQEVRTLAPQLEDRLSLYQLYPLLVHVNLFGGSYAMQVERILSRYA